MGRNVGRKTMYAFHRLSGELAEDERAAASRGLALGDQVPEVLLRTASGSLCEVRYPPNYRIIEEQLTHLSERIRVSRQIVSDASEAKLEELRNMRDASER